MVKVKTYITPMLILVKDGHVLSMDSIALQESPEAARVDIVVFRGNGNQASARPY